MVGQLSCRVPTDWFLDPSMCWFEWQTLVSAMLALLAAFIGALFLNRQIIQSERHERARVSRRYRASRRTLRLALHDVDEFAQASIYSLEAAYNAFVATGSDLADCDFEIPKLSELAQQRLSAILETSDDPSVISLVDSILNEIQVVLARMNSLRTRRARRGLVGISGNFCFCIIRCAALHAMSDGLFSYARQRSETAPISVSWDEVESVLDMLQLYPQDYPELFKLLEVRRQMHPSVWTANA